MQLVTRAQLGWPPSPAAPQATTLGTKVHYEGSPVPTSLLGDHSQCLTLWTAIRNAHLADPVQHWVDVAYNFGVCPHGWVLEGRGLGKETGANGNQDLNHAHYAVCGLLGDSGLTQPTDAMLNGLRDAIEYLQANGAGSEIKGHRDGYNTTCPGEPLYAWVQAGAPRPGGPVKPPTPVPAPQPAPGPAWPGEYLALRSPMLHDSNVRAIQARLAQRGWTISVDGWFGQQTDHVVRQFQTEKRLSPVDGIVGPVTWAAAFRTDNIT